LTLRLAEPFLIVSEILPDFSSLLFSMILYFAFAQNWRRYCFYRKALLGQEPAFAIIPAACFCRPFL
jgi:hypothetical protein